MRPSIFIVVLCLSALTAHAQARKPARSNQVCVDVATLKQGKAVRGLIVAGDGTVNSPWLMAAEREATSREHPQLVSRSAKAELQKTQQAYSELKTRIEQELAQLNLAQPSADEPNLIERYRNFLQSEAERFSEAQRALAGRDALQTRFMWLELKNKDCTNVRRASPDAQRVAVWAWSENLADVTKRDQADLERELVQVNIDVKLKVPDLSKDLPVRPEPEERWQARLAIVRYSMTRGIDFQGSADVYLRAGNGKAMDAAQMAAVMQKMMGGSIEALLSDLDPALKASQKQSKNGQWFSAVTSQVDQLKRREFRITRLDQDPNGQVATVETALVAKASNGWQIVWSSKQSCSAADVTAQDEEKISQDPQVKTALSALSLLGAGAEAEVKKAIRFGAATMAAQQAADREFAAFRDRYTGRLDGPPMQ